MRAHSARKILRDTLSIISGWSPFEGFMVAVITSISQAELFVNLLYGVVMNLNVCNRGPMSIWIDNCSVVL